MRRPRLLPLTMATIVILFGAKAADLIQALRPAFGLPAAHHLTGAAAATQANEPAPPPHSCAQHPDAAPPNGSLAIAPMNDTERAMLLDLRQRRSQLDARETRIASQEKLVAASAHRLGTRLDELTALQAKLQGLEDARRQHDEANWAGLVKLYEAMKPRDAAAIFNDLDMTVLLPVVDRMKDAKAALILAAMDPVKARTLTATLAQTRLRANSIVPGKGA